MGATRAAAAAPVPEGVADNGGGVVGAPDSDGGGATAEPALVGE
jgi:hypothetical protein